jgi:epoxyqueuosine reductase
MGEDVGSRTSDVGRTHKIAPEFGGGVVGSPGVTGRPHNAAFDIARLFADFFDAQPRVLTWGFVPLGAETVPAPHAQDLRAWVAQGLHADLGYMEQRLDERADPRVFAPWAKAAILFSVRQPFPFDTEGSNRADTLRVAAYARGKDYHRVCHRIMDTLEDQLKVNAPEVRFERFCDTAPVFERDLAAEAGLGWRGKNATLIHKTHGSGFLIAGFFLDVDPAVFGPPPEPAADFCGGCTACLTACPTDAFVAPGKLDANKCISYWTIEHKGTIPTEVSSKFGQWMYGCDACQDACPWNRKPSRRHAADLEANPHPVDEPLAPGDWPRDAEAWLKLLRRNGGFRSLMRHTPLKRAGRRMLIRNVLIAMRNTGTELSEEWREILRSEEDDEAVMREINAQ